MTYINRIALTGSGICVVLLGLLIATSVSLRETIGVAVPDVINIAQELMVGAVILPLATVTAQRHHIAVEFLYNKMSHGWQKRVVLIGDILSTLSVLPLLYVAGREALHTFERGSYFFGELNLPEWPGRTMFLIGVALLQIQLILNLIRRRAD